MATIIEILKYIFYSFSTIALLLGGILTALFGFLAATSKKERTPKWIAWGAFIAGFIVVLASILSGYQEHQASEKLQAKTNEIAMLSEKIAELAQKNSALNKKIADSISGGNSYCYLFVSPPEESNTAHYRLRTEGENPLYDVQVRISDVSKHSAYLDDMVKKKDVDLAWSMKDPLKQMFKFTKIYPIGNISAGMMYPLGTFYLPNDSDKQRYLIDILARNGRFLQHLDFRRIKGKWKYTDIVHANKEVVRKHIPPDFPRDQNDRIWGE
jgi:hypothetical protein